MRRWQKVVVRTVRVSIDRLRVWLLVGAGALVAVLAGFLEYAHLANHRLLKNLPGRLGAEISREANGFTYSQSNGKRTLYTIHAAKFVQRRNNVVTLRDVGVVLYDTAGHADRIFGKEFEFDQTAGVLRASGEVFLDLAAPAPGSAKERAAFAAGAPAAKAEDETEEQSAADPRAVHVRTRGVEFRQKEGVATTDEQVEFRYGAMRGSALGAEFRSETGVTVLRSRVELDAVREGRPLRLMASHAEMDRRLQEVRLERAEATGVGVGGAEGSASADAATVLLRTAERPEEVRAEGEVVLRGKGATVRAARGTVVLGDGDEPRSAELAGGVRYAAEEGARHAEGEAAEAHAVFAGTGMLQRVRLMGGASAREREGAGDRTLTATGMDLVFAPVVGMGGQASRGGAQQVWLREVTATGTARMVAHQGVAGAGGRVRTDEVAGDVLVAHLALAGRREEVAGVEGAGKTVVRRERADGTRMESFGDRLQAVFGDGGRTVETAEQVGHVRLEQRTAATAGKAASVSRGSAERVRYVAATELATLDGGVQLAEEDGVLWADEVAVTQGSGDTRASGRVRASYKTAGSGGEPVSVEAARAELRHEAGMATFFGGQDGAGGRRARMWQGGSSQSSESSVEAAVIEVAQKDGVLRAHGVVGAAESAAVRTVLAGGGTSAGAAGAPVTRVASRTLVYSDRTRQAVFAGGVQVVQGGMRLRGEETTVFLLPAKPGAGAAGTPGRSGTGAGASAAGPGVGGTERGGAAFPGGGSVERIVTTGAVHVEEGGRQATGDRLVYTAADRVSLLTGEAGRLPVVTDPENGTLSGAEIRFGPGDGGQSAVMVSGGGTSQPKVRKDTRVR